MICSIFRFIAQTDERLHGLERRPATQPTNPAAERGMVVYMVEVGGWGVCRDNAAPEPLDGSVRVAALGGSVSACVAGGRFGARRRGSVDGDMHRAIRKREAKAT